MRIEFRKLGWILAALLLVVSWVQPQAGSAADIYKWHDADGTLHFGDTPPPEAEYQEMDGQAPAPAGASMASAEARGGLESGPDPAGGMFWKVAPGGAQVSYLLGTIHSEDPRVTDLAPAVRRALESANGLVLEMVPDAAALTAAAASMLYMDGRTLEDVLGEALYRRSLDALALYGIPAAAAARMKPWAVMTTLSMPKPRSGHFLDMVLYGRAVELGIPVYGLETPQEQLAVFETIPEIDQVALLEQTLDELPTIPATLEEITRAYVAGDLEGVVRLAKAAMGAQQSQIADDLLHRLNEERNLRMVQRLGPYLSDGSVFVAVGALHLAGDRGLIELLRQNGYQVTAVPQS